MQVHHRPGHQHPSPGVRVEQPAAPGRRGHSERLRPAACTREEQGRVHVPSVGRGRSCGRGARPATVRWARSGSLSTPAGKLSTARTASRRWTAGATAMACSRLSDSARSSARGAAVKSAPTTHSSAPTVMATERSERPSTPARAPTARVFPAARVMTNPQSGDRRRCSSGPATDR